MCLAKTVAGSSACPLTEDEANQERWQAVSLIPFQKGVKNKKVPAVTVTPKGDRPDGTFL